jgi:hypothetical protein
MQPVGFPYNFSLREHLRRALGAEAPEYALLARWTEDLPGWRAGLGERLGLLLRAPLETPEPPEVRLLDQERRPGFTVARLAIAVAADLAAPAYLLTPDPPPEAAPAVLCLGRHPAGKAALAGELDPAAGLAAALCRAGLRVLVPDLPGCGERAGDGPELAGALLARGDSPAAWQAREARLMLAYLAAAPETARGQVGLVATDGALGPALLAGCLSPEVKAVALHGDLRGPAEALAEQNCRLEAAWEVPAPGLLTLAGLSDLLAYLAPRPLLLAPETDAPSADRTLRLVEEAYERQGHGPRCEVHAEATPLPAFAVAAAEFLGVWLPAEMEM